MKMKRIGSFRIGPAEIIKQCHKIVIGFYTSNICLSVEMGVLRSVCYESFFAVLSVL